MNFRYTCLVLCFFTLGCSFGKETTEAPEELIESTTQTFLEYEMASTKKLLGPCEIDSSSSQCIDFLIEYPVIQNGRISEEVISKLNTAIEFTILSFFETEAVPKSIGEIESELLESYEVLVDEENYSTPWTIEVQSDIIYQDSLYISLASSIFTYTGGAHPNSTQIYSSYSLQDGSKIELEDVFVEGYQEKFFRAAEIEFRMQEEIPPNESLEERGYFFENGEFALNDNFAVLNNSILFYFNPYEIAPYVKGGTELELKLTDFVNLIDEKGILQHLGN